MPVTETDLLAAGRTVKALVHDLNNQLGVVLAYAEMLRLDIQDDTEAATMLDDIVLAVKRGDSLLEIAAALTAREAGLVQRVDLNGLLNSASPLLSHRFSDAGAHLEIHLRDEPVEVNAVRVLIVRGLFHVADWILAQLGHARDSTVADVRLTIHAEGDAWELLWETEDESLDASGVTEGTRQAMACFGTHGGSIAVEPTRVRCRIPRETGLEIGFMPG